MSTNVFRTLLSRRGSSTYIGLATILALSLPLAAQPLSNASLVSAYYVDYLGVDTNSHAQSYQGVFTFDGKGAYLPIGNGLTTATSDHVLKLIGSGDYQVLSSGVVNLLNPFDSSGKSRFHGGLGAGILVASSRNSSFDDILVAVPSGSGESVATLNGTYRVASLDFLNGNVSLSRGTSFSMAFDGKGGLGNVTISGTAINLNNVNTIQTSVGATYTVGATGIGTLVLPAPSGVSADKQLLAGTRTMYVAPDGSFFVAGSASTYDMIVGVKANPGNNPQLAFSGLYFRVYLDNSSQGPTVADQNIWDGQGVVNEISSLKLELGNDRTNYTDYNNAANPFAPAGLDYMYAADLTLGADGTTSDGRGLGAGGNIMISGTNSGSDYAIAVRAKCPTMSGTGVFLNPQGVVNAASNAPFTSPVAPGELITLYGTGLSSQTATAALPFPNTLGGVSVTINNLLAPIYYVSPTAISVVVPFSIPTNDSFLNIQVTNGGTASNVVQVYSGFASPGIFTVPSGGVGSGAILHADYTLVTAANPAKPGETVQVYLTGLGPVAPTVAAGTAAPSNPLSKTDPNWVFVYVGGVQAVVPYSGLAPGLAGLYQINITIPKGLSPGDADIDISVGPFTTDYFVADYDVATIPIGK